MQVMIEDSCPPVKRTKKEWTLKRIEEPAQYVLTSVELVHEDVVETSVVAKIEEDSSDSDSDSDASEEDDQVFWSTEISPSEF